MRRTILVSCAALALAACHGTPPPRRAGWWLQTFTRDGQTRQLGVFHFIRLCVGPGMDAQSPIFNFDQAVKMAHTQNCAAPTANRGFDGVYSFSSTCPKPGGGTIVTKGTASGDFTAAYHLKIESTVTGAPFDFENGRHVTDIDGKWLGPCPAGMASGDMQLANGMKAPGGVLVDPHRTLPRPSP
jgi:hypothetical protein